QSIVCRISNIVGVTFRITNITFIQTVTTYNTTWNTQEILIPLQDVLSLEEEEYCEFLVSPSTDFIYGIGSITLEIDTIDRGKISLKQNSPQSLSYITSWSSKTSKASNISSHFIFSVFLFFIMFFLLFLNRTLRKRSIY
ncbi:MAG: hypothetical protein ACXAB2_09460, partial [Candidatus Hodarchaeales archaeon]